MESVWKSFTNGVDAIKDKLNELEIKNKLQNMASVEKYYYYSQ